MGKPKMTRQRYSKKESLNRILLQLQGSGLSSDTPDTLPPNVLSEDEVLSDLAELLAGSLPGVSAFPPTAMSRYGNMYFDNTNVVVDILVSGAYARVPTGSVAGVLNGVTFQNSRELVVSTAGKYLVEWQMSFFTATLGMEIEGAVMINGSGQSRATAHASSVTSVIPVSISASSIFSLAKDDVVALAVRNAAATEDVTIQHLQLTLFLLSV